MKSSEYVRRAVISTLEADGIAPLGNFYHDSTPNLAGEDLRARDDDLVERNFLSNFR